MWRPVGSGRSPPPAYGHLSGDLCAAATLTGVFRCSRWRRWAWVAALGVLVGCSNGPERRDGRQTGEVARQRTVYVAIGASDSAGVGADRPLDQAWPEVLRRDHLPDDTVLTNLAVPGATVAGAISHQLPQALALRPTLATVWLNANDIVAGVPPATYEDQLRRLVRALRRDGATKVLVANTPPLERLPAYRACRSGAANPFCRQAVLVPPALLEGVVKTYNDAIGRVASAEGAVLVDLHAAAMEVLAQGRWPQLVSGDGFHPSTAGHREVAEAFARAL
jgi:acyl-CoA thioesterase-1